MSVAAQSLLDRGEIDVDTLADWRMNGVAHALIDVREPWEAEICAISGSLNIPLAELAESLDMIPSDRPVVAVCHHGIRSADAVAWLRAKGIDEAVNLIGGIERWALRVAPDMRRY